MFSTNEKNTENMEKNCLHKDDVKKNVCGDVYVLKKCLHKKISHTPLQKNNGPSLTDSWMDI